MIQDDPRIDKLVVTVTDARAGGHCARGIKAWCDQNGFDFREAIRHGIPARMLVDINDAFGLRIVDQKLGSDHVEQQAENNH